MGFNEFGQSIFGIILLGIAMMVVFGGFQNQGLYEGFLPNGVTGPNDINNYQTGITVDSSVDPYATIPSGTPSQDNNPLFNFIANDIPEFLNAFAKTASASVDALSYIGIPREISYVIIVIIAPAMSLLAIYFIGTVALGLFGRLG